MDGSGIWLFFAAPQWYLEGLFSFEGQILSGFPIVGLLCLLIGVFQGIARRRPGLFIFLAPFAASQIFVASAGFARGASRSQDWGGWIVLAFLIFQLVASGFLIFRFKGTRLAASMLSAFNLSFAWAAAFVSSVALADVWL